MFNLKSVLSFIKQQKVPIKVVSSSYIALPVNILVAFFSFRIIDPYYMGIWSAVTIFESYAQILRFGIVNGMNRELPFAIGSGDNDKAISFAQTTLAYNLFCAIIPLLIFPILITSYAFNKIYIICILIVVIRVSLEFYSSYVIGTYRTTENFNKLSNIQFFISGVNLIFAPILIYYLNFLGYLFYQLIQVILNTVLFHFARPFRIKPHIDFKILTLLFKTGFPIFVSSYLIQFVNTIPKILILKTGNETLLGIFTPVLVMLNAFSLLPNSLATYFYPKFSYSFGKTGSAKLIFKQLLKIYIIIIAIFIPIIIFCIFLLDYVILFFPKYTASLPYLKIALCAVPFLLAKLGNLINVVLKNVSFIGIYVSLYAFFQITILIILKFFLKDILMVAILSIIFTDVALFFSSLFINKLAVDKYSKKSSLYKCRNKDFHE